MILTHSSIFDLWAQHFVMLFDCATIILSLMPASCDGCRGDFSLTNALGCHKGNLITQYHNEIRDALSGLAALGYWEVVCEPMVYDGIGDSPALIADLEIRGIWIPQAKSLFDVQVTATDASSYVGQSVFAVLPSYEMPLLLLLLYL